MDNLSIDNALLRPRLAEGWQLDGLQQPPCIHNPGKKYRIDINEITMMILSVCTGEQSVKHIIEQFQGQFPEAQADIAEDVETVLAELQQKQVLSFIPALTTEVFAVPEKSPRHDKQMLCIGMATYDDYDGVYFSVQALRLYHPEILDKIEIVVIDNHPDGPCAAALKTLEYWVENYRYIPCERIRGTAVRDVIFREANADYVLCLDSHVLVEAGAVAKLLEYFEANPGCKDFLQGPLLNDNLGGISSHFVPGWSQGMYGTWGSDARADDKHAPAFDVPMQGLGLFACAKSAWPGFNPRFSGFGGEEGYIHEKIRQAGGRTLCLPFLRWLHRFNRPMGAPYTVSWADRIRNYLIGRDELGMEDQDIIEHFNEHIGASNTQEIVSRVRDEIAQPYYYFDALYCLIGEQDRQTWVNVQRTLDQAGLLHRIVAVDKSDYAGVESVANVLAFRDLVEQAQQSGYRNMLIFDPGSVSQMLTDLAQTPAKFTQALDQSSWAVFYPVRCETRQKVSPALGLIDSAEPFRAKDCPVCIHQQAFAGLLTAIPIEPEAIEVWLTREGSLAGYLNRCLSPQFCLST